jgi:hypothetical protein
VTTPRASRLVKTTGSLRDGFSLDAGSIGTETAFTELEVKRYNQIRNLKNLVSVCSDWQHHLASLRTANHAAVLTGEIDYC